MKSFFSDWRVSWFLLLLPVALFFSAWPIDETRYLSVAWEMRSSGQMLMPHLNGALYSDKGPLLFWLINLAWLVAGLHVWIVRLGVLFVSLASLILFERLVRRLDPVDAQRGGGLAARAAVILSGILFFAAFASAIMFDVLLTTCVLISLHGVLDLDAGRWRRGVAVIALGLSLGLLTKGAVVLLDACLVGLFAPWWSETARVQVRRWYACILLGVLGGVIIGLIWALLAYRGFDAFWQAVVMRQTVGRISASFAHARPIWWYFMVLPFMLLPWTLSLRGPWRAWRDSLFADKASRFGVVWFVPAFLVFCLVSGKQLHYLLPLLPGLALYFSHVLRDDASRVRGRPFGLLLLLFGLGLAATPYLAEHAATLPWLGKLVQNGGFSPDEQKAIGGVWPAWGLLIALVGGFLLAHPRAHVQLRAMALCSAASVALGILAFSQAFGPTADVTATAQYIRAAQEAGKPIVHLGQHHGLFGFPGRLTQPLEIVDFAHLYDWTAKHPDGEVITFYGKYTAHAGIMTPPIAKIPYRIGSVIQIWRAADLNAGPHATPSAKPDEDDTPDD